MTSAYKMLPLLILLDKLFKKTSDTKTFFLLLHQLQNRYSFSSLMLEILLVQQS